MRLRTCTKIHQEVLFSKRRDGITGIKQRRHDLSGDDVWILAMVSQRSQLKVDLEPSTWLRRQKHQATLSHRYAYIYKTVFRVKECDAALETLPADMEAGKKATLMKKAYNTLKLCGDIVVREGIIEKEDVLATLNLRKLKKRTEGTKEETGDGLYVKGMLDHLGKAHSGRSSQFKSWVELVKGGGSGVGVDTAYPRCLALDFSDVLCPIWGCDIEGHLKRDCLIKKSSGFVKKGKRDQDSDSSDDEGNTYFREFRNDKMTELVMDSGGSYHMTHMRDFLYDFKVVDGGSVQLGDNRTCAAKGTGKVKIQLHDGSSFILEDVRYVLGSRRSLISLGTLEKEVYTMKMQMGKIKVIKGCWIMMTGIRKKNCVYTLDAKVMSLCTKSLRFKTSGLKQLGSKQVGFKQLGHKQVGFKQLAPELQVAQGDREAEVFQVSNDDAAVAQKRLEDKQLKEKTNMDFLVKDKENVHLGIKVGANIMVTEVPGQEGK
ncbi:hypothetical protein Tco_0091236 [Tanacetum coccineum]